jgi:hypothetical protein
VTEASTPEAWLITEPSEEDFSPEIIFWRDRVRTGGGEPLLATMVAYEQFIQSEKFYGLWAKTVDYAMLWKQSTENQAVALTSLKLGLRLVANNGPWSMDGLGYSFDGMASDITWPVILSVQGSSIMSPTDQRIEVYVVSSLGKNSQVIGSNSGGGASLGIKPLQNSLMRINFGSQTADFLLPQNADGHSLGGGLSAGSRTAASLNIIQGYKNGVKFPDVTTPTPMLTGLSSQSISIGSYNSIGAALSFVEATVAYASVGAPFTEEEEAIRWTILSRLIALNRAEFFDPKATEE